jgi:hypothetical protein
LIDLLPQIAAVPATAAAKTPPPLPANLLGQIQLKLISNEGTLKFEVHNGTGWVCGAFPQYAPMVAGRAGTLNHATSSIELKPMSEITTEPYVSSVFTAEVGDFLNEIATDYGQGPVSDPTYLNTSIVQASGISP